MIVYHGTSHDKVEFNAAYNYERIWNGLGIYWTISKEEATRYGNRLFRRSLNGARLISAGMDRFIDKDIENWFDKLSEMDKDLYLTVLSNWDEQEHVALRKITKLILEKETALEEWLTFQSELMIRDCPKWCKLAQRLGVDGIVVVDPLQTGDKKSVHYIMYDEVPVENV